jgi:hypothetical protein
VLCEADLLSTEFGQGKVGDLEGDLDVEWLAHWVPLLLEPLRLGPGAKPSIPASHILARSFWGIRLC